MFADKRQIVRKGAEIYLAEIKLVRLSESDREQFILDNQEAFNYGALEEFGRRDDHFEEDGQIISRETIEQSIDSGEAYRIVCDGQNVGGVILKVEGERGDLEILFVSPDVHSKGIGYAAWCEVEKLHPEVKVWETVTPYFEKRNIHFYVNPKCRNRLMSSFRMACSGLKKEWDKNSIMKRGIGPLSVQLPDAFEFIMPAC